MEKPIKLIIIDDDQLILSLLSEFLAAQQGIEMLNTYTSAEDFLEAKSKCPQMADIIILDLKMKKISGIALLEILNQQKYPAKPIVVTSHYNKSFMGFMLKTGATAFLPKGISPLKLLDVIREVNKRGFSFQPEQMEVIRQQVSSKSPQPILHPEGLLSDREIEIIQLICQQKTSIEIGEILYLSKRTVENHKSNIFTKTGVKNVAGIVVYAAQNKIVEISELPIF